MDQKKVFAHPVDTTHITDYPEFVKNPMDFGTMKTKVDKGAYFTIDEFQVGGYSCFFSVHHRMR
jgi:bromodomain-containing protein 7/9